MQVKERTRRDIEDKLLEMGDYVKMGYLQSCLKNPLDIETKRFVLFRLAGIYEQRRMFGDAAKLMKIASDLNPTEKGRVVDLVKASELFVKSGDFSESLFCFRKAISHSTEIEKNRVKESVKQSYKTQARILLGKGKRRNAMEVYECLLREFDLDIQEKLNVKKELLGLYDRLGKIREFSKLKEN